MTLIDGSIASLLARLQMIGDPTARLMAFGAAIVECDGILHLPCTGARIGSHLVEVSLHGVVGRGLTADAALDEWMACARRLCSPDRGAA